VFHPSLKFERNPPGEFSFFPFKSGETIVLVKEGLSEQSSERFGCKT